MNKDSIERGLRVFVPSFLASIFCFTVYGSWDAYRDNEAWKIGDWLINYQGGFVRRGLCGELFFQLSSLTHVSPALYVFLLQIICYSCFFIFSFLLLRKQRSLMPYFLLIISPFIFTFQVGDIQGGYRKEIIYFAVLAFAAWSGLVHNQKKFEYIFLITLAVYPLVVLSHEMLALFLPYIVAIRFLRTGQTRIKLNVILLLGSLSVISFLASINSRGTAEQVEAICNSLGDYRPAFRGAVSCLSNSAMQEMDTVLSYISNEYFIEAYFCVLLLCMVAYLPIINKMQSIIHNRPAFILIGISIIGSIALFLVAVDWGRFIYIHLVSLFVLSLIPESFCSAEENRRGAKWFCADRLFQNNGSINKALFVFYILFAVSYASCWSLPHSSGNNNFIRGSAVYLIYKQIEGNGYP
jgi:hypothetical protein